MLGVRVVHGSDISFVFSWPWHVHILIGSSSCPYTHMELRLLLCFFKVSFHSVAVGGRSLEFGFESISLGSAKLRRDTSVSIKFRLFPLALSVKGIIGVVHFIVN